MEVEAEKETEILRTNLAEDGMGAEEREEREKEREEDALGEERANPGRRKESEGATGRAQPTVPRSPC